MESDTPDEENLKLVDNIDDDHLKYTYTKRKEIVITRDSFKEYQI